MQGDWIANVVTAIVVLFVVGFFAVALRKARRRRREQFSDDEVPVVRPVPPTPSAAKLPSITPGETDLESAADEQTDAAEDEETAAAAAATDAAGASAAGEGLDGDSGAAPGEAEADQPLAADDRLAAGLSRTRASLWGRLKELIERKPTIDAALYGQLEEALLSADLGVSLVGRLLKDIRARPATSGGGIDGVRTALKAKVLEALNATGADDAPLFDSGATPTVILFVGVNGVGKTTTIGKIAALCRARQKSVVLAAGDTFRAAAVEQLAVWAERTGSALIRGETGADPASVIFNAVNHAKEAHADIVLADTAGRLHTKSDLMDEIKKVKRAAGKARSGAPDHTWLVVDATTGQNALQQAREFHQALGLSGVILTKLDGTAKGGVVVAIADAVKLKVRFVGVGEKPDDLRPFVATSFVDALFAMPGERGIS
ncbi:MAG: signal recognition particle-docking protein FtsY [Deltaproteobacteria bacterium]|nr:signal recognition particle-docking protein FtsY [Deltaproteobacteria bacterium]